MIEPRKRNLITGVEGPKIGNAEDAGPICGTAVLIADQTVTAVADMRGVYEAQSLGRNKSYREIFGRG